MPLLMVGADTKKNGRKVKTITYMNMREEAKAVRLCQFCAPLTRGIGGTQEGCWRSWRLFFRQRMSGWSSGHANPARTCLMELAGVATVFPGLLEKGNASVFAAFFYCIVCICCDIHTSCPLIATSLRTFTSIFKTNCSRFGPSSKGRWPKCENPAFARTAPPAPGEINTRLSSGRLPKRAAAGVCMSRRKWCRCSVRA
jgi:hypothetical protein